MALILGPSTVQVYPVTWSEFKTLINNKLLSAKMQFDEDPSTYKVFFTEDSVVYLYFIYKGEVPQGSGFDQTQNDLDKDDFEINKKPYCNR